MAIVRAHQILGQDQKAATTIDQEELQQLFKDLSSHLRQGKFQNAKALLQRMVTQLPGLKKAANIFTNTIISVQEGLSTAEITKKAATEELRSALDIYKETLDSIIEDVTTHEQLDPVKDLPGLNNLSDYDSDANEIQVKLNKSGVFVGHAPVLPMASPPLSQEALKKNAFLAEDFNGYPILKKQLVVGFSNEYVQQHISKSMKREAVLEELVNIVKAKYKSLKLVQVGPAAGWYGATWFWLVPDRDLGLLRKSTISGPGSTSLKVSKWSFPFYRSGSGK